MSTADKQKRYRERTADGIRIIAVEVDGEMIATLEEAGLLAEWDEKNRDAIKAALDKAIALMKQRRYE